MKKRVTVEFDLDTDDYGTESEKVEFDSEVSQLVVGMIAGLVDWPFDPAGLARIGTIRDSVTITVKDA